MSGIEIRTRTDLEFCHWKTEIRTGLESESGHVRIWDFVIKKLKSGHVQNWNLLFMNENPDASEFQIFNSKISNPDASGIFIFTLGEISSDLYRASRCDIEKQTFLYIDFYQNLFYSLFAFHFLMIKNLRGKL